ncbi:hypothetical protein QRO08_15705 [Paracidovorax citrulli]|uniref:Uncharacterized protein n=2 Tax=Paracidovorax citrulli TaxID=80869 RepID=A1TN40_PARC0|nr:hypothetical protein [Paracidovorax citrulli]ABM32378.1 hypothetical protein Aave_1793 [Paracidovorax citrulli AAC00-1]ATG94603.1 hypothetical protein CQB05_11690 [Paracidovorax citrulli]MVT28494.1 hypothetical protein [Paracidovorax citrulli]MVT38656.1 hypothetical protein [Paracidovorax citrulli]PVY66594.1 hypothetical protein C8E08_4004 [Paracidovorax citrulli]
MSNLAKLTITPGGPWHLYQHAAVPGWEMLGTVQRGDEIGALARVKATGILVMMRAGVVSTLNQRKAQAALDAQAR